MALPKKIEPRPPADIIETILIKGDLSRLTPEESNEYLLKVCEYTGLNPLTRPFEYITFQNKKILYAKKDATDQLRMKHGISVVDMQESEVSGVYIVTTKVVNRDGRTDFGKGAVSIKGLQGEPLANAFMKAETKSKRRATLSICGLGMLDQTEADDMVAQEKDMVERGRTMSKKDARPLYEKLQTEMREQTTLDELQAWWKIVNPRIKLLPEDWQDKIDLQKDSMKLEFQQQKIKDDEFDRMLASNGEEYDHDTGEVK
jgi:hypothetical protein